GRFAEELSFPRECRAAGLTPVLVVLDPTPSPRLVELIAAFTVNQGRHYVGADAWAHMESKAGKTMAVFLERYIRPPLTEMAKHDEIGPESVQLSWSQSEISIQGGSARIHIPRNR
ncbi:MAG: restriction endonuclease, partial [Chthoniobacteraceae bacterium]